MELNANDIFLKVALGVRNVYLNYVFLTRNSYYQPEKYPYCYMTQIQNAPDRKTAIGNEPVLWEQSYEWQLYSNKIDDGLDELESISNIIIKEMIDIGFKLTLNQEIPNLIDEHITKKVLRFTGKVGDKYVYI